MRKGKEREEWEGKREGKGGEEKGPRALHQDPHASPPHPSTSARGKGATEAMPMGPDYSVTPLAG